MEYWLRNRNYHVVQREDIEIPKFQFPNDMISIEDAETHEDMFRPKNAIDTNIPHALGCVCKGSVTIRVLANASNGTQSFLLVQKNQTQTMPKRDIVELCNNFLSFADCILVTNQLSQSSRDTIQATNKRCGFNVTLLLLHELTCDKLASLAVPDYKLLNAEEVKALEAKIMCNHTKFPRMFACDPISRYLRFPPGSVVQTTDKKTRTISYRYIPSRSDQITHPIVAVSETKNKTDDEDE